MTAPPSCIICLFLNKSFAGSSLGGRRDLTFGSFQLMPMQRTLLDRGKRLRLGSRALDILVTLVERAGRTVYKDELIARVWPDTHIDEASLRVHIAALRKALGDDRAGNRFITNVPGRGYVFVASAAREQNQPFVVPPRRQMPGNDIPALLTRIIGRDAVIASLTEQLGRRRLLTIVGPGGIGKTTVASAVAEAVHPDVRRRRLVCRVGLIAEPRSRAKCAGRRAWNSVAWRQSCGRTGCVAAGQAGPDRIGQLRARRQCCCHTCRGDCKVGSACLRAGHQPRAVACRG